jgi:hypothetical protein
MTIEQRTVVPLGDIQAIEFECNHCHSTYSIPIPEVNHERLRLTCLNCPQQFASTERKNNAKNSDAEVLGSLLLRLKDAQSRTFEAALRFVISDVKRTT